MSYEDARAAGYLDFGDWASKDLTGAYPPDTAFVISGEVVKPGDIPDLLGSDRAGDDGHAAPDQPPSEPGRIRR
jgi:hypothetical protein